MLRFDSNEIGWICCYLLRILSLFSSSSSFAFLLDNGRLFLPLRPYLFYPSRFPRTQSTSSNSLSYFISMYVWCACVRVSRFHIINIKIGTQSDVSKIRSTGNKEPSSQNELLQRKRDADLFVCVFLHSLFGQWKKGEVWRIGRETLSAIIFEIFPRRWSDVSSAIDKFHVCIWYAVPLELVWIEVNRILNRKSLEYKWAMETMVNDWNGTLANMKLNRGELILSVSFGQTWVCLYHVEAVEHLQPHQSLTLRPLHARVSAFAWKCICSIFTQCLFDFRHFVVAVVVSSIRVKYNLGISIAW